LRIVGYNFATEKNVGGFQKTLENSMFGMNNSPVFVHTQKGARMPGSDRNNNCVM